MASRDPKDLHRDLQLAWETMESRCAVQGVTVILTCTYRSPQEQANLYNQGRTTPGHIVTHAQAGQSKHNLSPSEAFDIAIIENGKCNWFLNSPSWSKVISIGRSLGLTCGADWAGDKKDSPHFELNEVPV